MVFVNFSCAGGGETILLLSSKGFDKDCFLRASKCRFWTW